MGTKMHGSMKKRVALIGAAVLPAAAGMFASSAFAAPTLTFQNLGTTKTATVTTTGWTSFLISVTADSGQVITAADLGSTTAPANGIFGQLLQKWNYTNNPGDTPTPTGTQANNGIDNSSADSHFLLVAGQTTAPVGTPTEDNDLSHPVGAPPSNANNQYGLGTFIHAVTGYSSPQTNTQPLAYIVLKDGTTGSINMDVAEAVSGFPGVGFHLTGSFSAGGGPVTNKIVSLTAVSGGAPTTYGNKLTNGAGVDKATFNPNAPVADSINVVGSNGSYIKGQANNINNGAGQSKFYVQASGFSPATDQEIYALNLTSGGTDTTPAQETTIANEINASQAGVAVNAVPFASAPASLQALFPGYDVFLTTTGSPSSPMFLGLDTTSISAAVPSVLVTDVAAVPEPASAAGVLLGAAGLLLGRRKRKA